MRPTGATWHFYPRSPCGERPHSFSHAIIILVLFLSTLSLRRATTFIFSCYYNTRIISIHALLAESDLSAYVRVTQRQRISIHALLAESDPTKKKINPANKTFLSTLSLRRATAVTTVVAGPSRDFYPRSPCGERQHPTNTKNRKRNFYPRSPCGERHLL